jgi:hypothetical protein
MSDSNASAKHNHAPTAPQLCMGIVQDYKRGAYSKVQAIKNIVDAFTESKAYQNASQNKINVAIETYLAMLDQHSVSHTIADA